MRQLAFLLLLMVLILPASAQTTITSDTKTLGSNSVLHVSFQSSQNITMYFNGSISSSQNISLNLLLLQNDNYSLWQHQAGYQSLLSEVLYTGNFSLNMPLVPNNTTTYHILLINDNQLSCTVSYTLWADTTTIQTIPMYFYPMLLPLLAILVRRKRS